MYDQGVLRNGPINMSVVLSVGILQVMVLYNIQASEPRQSAVETRFLTSRP